MRIAWFLARRPATPHPIDDTATLLAELGSLHEIELYDEPRAHDFVWQHGRRPFDVCVYELADTIADAFIWPYVLHYPGILRLRSGSLRSSRRQALRRSRRTADDRAEAAFAGRPALRIPMTASRLTVVADPYVARLLQETYPDARVRYATPAIRSGALSASAERATPATIGVMPTCDADRVQRAARRARDAGSAFVLRMDLQSQQAIAECDAVVALEWPPAPEPPLGAWLAIAAGRTAVVYEVPVTAAWPALDPQTWQPRGFEHDVQPIVISIDPRDDEHSLMLALRRLADDPALRTRLGDAAHAWARANANVRQVVTAWETLLAEAAAIAPPQLPANWPSHLAADGSERAREMLADMGVTVDFL